MFTKFVVGKWIVGLACLVVSAVACGGLPIQHWQTTNGARVYFVESRGLPLLDIAVEFDAGARRNLAEQAGLAGLTARTLGLGAGGLNEEEISRRFADVGAQFETSSDSDMSGVTLRTLSSERERTQALDLLARILQKPDFPVAAIERERARQIAAVQEEDTQPGPIAEKAFYSAIYGSHPYAKMGSGTVATLTGLQRDDVEDFYRRHYVADSAVIALVGDISRDQAAVIAERLSVGLPRANGGLPALPAVSSLTGGEVVRIPHPAAQSHILMGMPGISRNDPDYFPLYVGNYILGGGGFASRLTESVREKRGLAYSVYSYFMPMAQPGPFVIGLQTKRDQAEQALKIARSTLEHFQADGPSPDELRRAKLNIEGGFPLRLDSNKKILGYLAVIGFYNLPLDYLDRFVSNVDKVKLEDVKRAFKRRIDPARMVTVIVGGGV